MANASLMTRLRAKAAGEIPAATLEAYRAAEQRRAADPAAAAGPFFPGTGNAFALQTLGDAFVEADYEADPNTVGFVPPVTAEQALAFCAEVERLPLPGDPGFDPWCLTDPRTRSQWRADPSARRAIDVLWRADPSFEQTLRLRGEIDAALERGDVDYCEPTAGGR